MALSELGAFLQQKREELNLTLDDIEDRTRIRRRYLEAIEAGAWDSLPPGVYTRGLVKSYAKAVGVSPNSILRMYVKERPAEARLPEPQLISQPLVNEPRFSRESILAALGFLIAGAALVWLVRMELGPFIDEARARIAEGRPAAADTATTATQSAEDDPDGADAAVTDPGTSPTVDLGTAAAVTSGNATPRPTASPRPSATATPEPIEGLVVEVTATDQIWFRVVADGQELAQGFMQAGDTQTWQAQTSLSLRTGKAGSTVVKVNGQDLGPIGPTGNTVTCQWNVQPDATIVQTGC